MDLLYLADKFEGKRVEVRRAGLSPKLFGKCLGVSGAGVLVEVDHVLVLGIFHLGESAIRLVPWTNILAVDLIE